RSPSLPLPQLRDLALPLVLDMAALAAVLLFLFLPLGRLVEGLQAVLVEDLQLGELGFGLAADVGDLLAQLVAEGLLPRPLDALLLHPLEGQLVRRLHSGGLVLVRHGNRIASAAAYASNWHARRGGRRRNVADLSIFPRFTAERGPVCVAAPVLLR